MSEVFTTVEAIEAEREKRIAAAQKKIEENIAQRRREDDEKEAKSLRNNGSGHSSG
ncbi:hypothetical protein KKE34_00615 [Patescibacteria group bacterium]|nr:hypothetical protein [Patescibacteria group bacterium]MBU1885093.1 hypothetical protein [Patescibacteria group bacterium]